MSSYKSFFLGYEGILEDEVFIQEIFELFNLKNKKIEWAIWGCDVENEMTLIYLKLSKKLKVDSTGPLSILYYGKRIVPKMYSSRDQKKIILYLNENIFYLNQFKFNVEEYLKKNKYLINKNKK